MVAASVIPPIIISLPTNCSLNFFNSSTFPSALNLKNVNVYQLTNHLLGIIKNQLFCQIPFVKLATLLTGVNNAN